MSESGGWFPEPGSVWHDAEGRELTVHHVVPNDRDGRQIRGRILSGDGEERDYSTSQAVFVPVWKDRRPYIPGERPRS